MRLKMYVVCAFRYLYCSKKYIHLLVLEVHLLGLGYISIENNYAQKIHILDTSDIRCHMLLFLRYVFLTPYRRLVCYLQP